jgi:uncharacterized membrane protein YeaQ/YmgE (transglycosylase-associated protein family)
MSEHSFRHRSRGDTALTLNREALSFPIRLGLARNRRFNELITFIIGWIVIGLIAGFLANLVMHGGHGMIFDILLGLVGAVIIGAILGFHTDSLTGHIIVSFIGAVIAVAVVRLVERRSVFG